MNADLLNPKSDGTSATSVHPVSVIMAYEDVPTRAEAAQRCDALVQSHLSATDFACAWWKLDHLRDQHAFAAATAVAVTADMIVFSINAMGEFSPAVKGWIRAWLGHREAPTGALVVLVGQTAANQSRSAKELFLESVAPEAGMGFSSHHFVLPEEQARFSPAYLKERAERTTAVLREILDRAPHAPRWGINE